MLIAAASERQAVKIDQVQRLVRRFGPRHDADREQGSAIWLPARWYLLGHCQPRSRCSRLCVAYELPRLIRRALGKSQDITVLSAVISGIKHPLDRRRQFELPTGVHRREIAARLPLQKTAVQLAEGTGC